ncbi:cytochrome c [Breoghania sp. L-A4]|uniref:cytochrome c n=1 Tax=Breoghania sp. L-A4 TaxID=2304600 RepID=UPI0013C3632C|nr:cytochrome c [Breoghania sp. L-A4]
MRDEDEAVGTAALDRLAGELANFDVTSLNTTIAAAAHFAKAAPAILAGVLALAAQSAPAAARDLFEPEAFATYQADVGNGRYMANATGCLACHAAGNDLALPAGGLKLDTYIGTFHVPNSTAHPSATGGWSNADYLNAVINGVTPDGRNYYPVFPYAAYAGMTPQDVLDIKAYTETLTPSDNTAPRHEISFPYNLNATISLWKRNNFDTPAFQPGDSSQMSRGRYLVENVGACGECHTPRTLTWGWTRTPTCWRRSSK